MLHVLSDIWGALEVSNQATLKMCQLHWESEVITQSAELEPNGEAVRVLSAGASCRG